VSFIYSCPSRQMKQSLIDSVSEYIQLSFKANETILNIQCQWFVIYSCPSRQMKQSLIDSVSDLLYTVSVICYIQCQWFVIYSVSDLLYTVSVICYIQCQWFVIYSVSDLLYTVALQGWFDCILCLRSSYQEMGVLLPLTSLLHQIPRLYEVRI
jgi:phenylpyruvate tautomerase PptA (4-oxalocrotonate tautomerase family)